MKMGVYLVVLTGILLWFIVQDGERDQYVPMPQARQSLAMKMENNQKRWEYHLLRMKDPKTGAIPSNLYQLEKKFLDEAPIRKRDKNSLFFQSRGPDNRGGRTRAVAFDVSDTSGRTLLAGGVTSGVFRTTDRGNSWTKVSPINRLHSVTALAQDPTNPDTWYYGTGELLGFRGRWGDGIWKSVDKGLTWFQLEATASDEGEDLDNVYDIVHRLAVDPATGHVYAAIHRNIMRSTDGGKTWEATLGTDESALLFESITDIVISSDGTSFYASFHQNAPEARGGIWHSSTGEPESWTQIADAGPVRSFPDGWGAAGGQGRAVMALDPSD